MKAYSSGHGEKSASFALKKNHRLTTGAAGASRRGHDNVPFKLNNTIPGVRSSLLLSAFVPSVPFLCPAIVAHSAQFST